MVYSDRALLEAAADMIGIAVGNASLHDQVLDLMRERERVHESALQTVRLATIGRLTATLSHEIKNPMQAIRGALALAMEAPADKELLADYIPMCLRESERVIELVERMSRIYREQDTAPGTFCLNRALEESALNVQKELTRNEVNLQLDLAEDKCEVAGVEDQLGVVFTNMILNLSDAVQTAGGGNLLIRTNRQDGFVRVEFSTDVPIPGWPAKADLEIHRSPTELSGGLSLSGDILSALGGGVFHSVEANRSVVEVRLPIPKAN